MSELISYLWTGGNAVTCIDSPACMVRAEVWLPVAYPESAGRSPEPQPGSGHPTHKGLGPGGRSRTKYRRSSARAPGRGCYSETATPQPAIIVWVQRGFQEPTPCHASQRLSTPSQAGLYLGRLLRWGQSSATVRHRRPGDPVDPAARP